MSKSRKHRKAQRHNIGLYVSNIARELHYLDDFLREIRLIDFREDVLRVRACERSLEIIGETAGRIYRYLSADIAAQQLNSLMNLQKLANFRNILSHEYFSVEAEEVFKSVHVLLPLRSAIEDLADEVLRRPKPSASQQQ